MREIFLHLNLTFRLDVMNLDVIFLISIFKTTFPPFFYFGVTGTLGACDARHARSTFTYVMFFLQKMIL